MTIQTAKATEVDSHREPVVLVCKRGHEFDTGWTVNAYLDVGDRCPHKVGIDELKGLIRCGKPLKRKRVQPHD